MFKDKTLHSVVSSIQDAVVVLIDKLKLLADEHNNTVAATNNNFEVVFGKQTELSQQVAEVYAKVNGLAKVEADYTTLVEQFKSTLLELSQAREYAANRDRLVTKLEQDVQELESKIKGLLSRPEPIQQSAQQPIVVNNQFNMQELANELSKYLNPKPVASSGLQSSYDQQPEQVQNPSPFHTHESNVQKFFGLGATELPQAAEYKPSNVMAGSMAIDDSLIQSPTYIPSPSTEEVDEIMAEQTVFIDPALAERISTRQSGPVALPSQRQLAYQVAELGGVGVLQQDRPS